MLLIDCVDAPADAGVMLVQIPIVAALLRTATMAERRTCFFMACSLFLVMKVPKDNVPGIGAPTYP
jgi:hypothetical protein